MRLLTAFLLAALPIGAACAQDQLPANSQAADGQALTALSLWDKVKLSAAYYTNPHLVQQIRINYGYDPKSFDDEKLSDLEKQGAVICVVSKTPGSMSGAYTFTAVSCDKTSRSAYVVSYKPDLLGKKSDMLFSLDGKPEDK
jgi:hypothetical protein